MNTWLETQIQSGYTKTDVGIQQADDDSEAVDDVPIQSQRRQSKSCVPDEEDSFEILESFGNDSAGEERRKYSFEVIPNVQHY